MCGRDFEVLIDGAIVGRIFKANACACRNAVYPTISASRILRKRHRIDG
jgi:hypothetical protein